MLKGRTQRSVRTRFSLTTRLTHRRACLTAILTAVFIGNACSRRPADKTAGNGRAGRNAVTALGRVTPGRAIISIGAPPGARLLKLNAAEGMKVSSGEILGTLDSHPVRQAEADAAKVALKEARERRLAETAYGEALVEQSQAGVHLLKLSVDHERKELKRILSLASNLAATEKRLDKNYEHHSTLKENR